VVAGAGAGAGVSEWLLLPPRGVTIDTIVSQNEAACPLGTKAASCGILLGPGSSVGTSATATVAIESVWIMQARALGSL
jgi:hypothetical protein